MVQPDKRLLWHPRKTNKFVVGGHSQITLYEWASEYPEIRHITSQHDLNFMKASHPFLGTRSGTTSRAHSKDVDLEYYSFGNYPKASLMCF